MFSIDNQWFFKELPPIFKVFLFFVRGDLIVLLPLLFIVLLLGFISVEFMIFMIGVYITVRYFGEMIYWFAHQFNERKYRPHDFGFKKLDNHAIYILYQTFAVAGTVLGIGIAAYSLLLMK